MMDYFKDIDLGSTLLSIFVAAGFVAFIILIIRTVIIALNYLYTKFKDNKPKPQESKKTFNSKGF